MAYGYNPNVLLMQSPAARPPVAQMAQDTVAEMAKRRCKHGRTKAGRCRKKAK